MFRTNVVLALVVLYVGMAHSWDIAVSVGDRIEFYTNRNRIVTVHFKTNNLTEIAYDEVHNMMLFIDKQSDSDAICGFNIGSMDTRCFIKRTGSNIQDLAFDPVTELLFFTDTKEGSINWISLKDQESQDNVFGNLLIKIDNPPVKNIAVDSCTGYIYWTNAYENALENIMEKTRFDGSGREVIYKWLPVYSFAIDPQTHTNYYIEGLGSAPSSYYRKADLRERENLYSEKSKFIYSNNNNFRLSFSAPKELTVSKDYIYWINSSMGHTTVWQRPKNASYIEEPKEMISFHKKKPVGIAANYRIREQVEGLEDCEVLSSLIRTVTVTDNPPNIEQNKQKEPTAKTDQTTVSEQATEIELICVHGVKVSETSVCKCTPGYTGERCDVPACEKYCLQGNCTYNDEGLPKCRCNAGYSGERCERDNVTTVLTTLH